MLKRAGGIRYEDVLARLHGAMLFDWYLEVGCRYGDTLVPCASPTVAIDPFFRLRHDVLGRKPALHLLQSTSDAVWDSGFLARMGISPAFAFLDGMHLIEYLIRDFRAVEAAAAPGAVIAIHDCCPWYPAMTTRDTTDIGAKPWTGDVWKMLPILARFRPDLKVTVLNASPTGLVLVSNLDPGNRVFTDRHDKILAAFDCDIEAYGLQRFADGFAFTKCMDYVNAGFPDFAAVRRPVDGALTLQIHST